MKWVKKGLIFAAQGQSEWMLTHAAVPFADYLGEDLFRVYFSARDERNRAQVGYFEINITRPLEILHVHDNPVIALGPLGAYDDNGAISSWIVSLDDRKYCYYSGMTLGVTVPFYFYTGLAVSLDGGRSFQKLSASPILDRGRIDPYLTGHVCVRREDGRWKMWYVSGEHWEMENNRPKHFYNIKYAESYDGVNWNRTGAVCIDFKVRDEYAISRPSVTKEDGIYEMWYSYRGDSYRIGYAESVNGIDWERKDEQVGIDVSDAGWDSEMIEYAHVFDHKGQRYMLYNGNAYGKTGIGLAILASD